MTIKTVYFHRQGWRGTNAGRNRKRYKKYRGPHRSLASKIKKISLAQCETKKSYQRLTPGTAARELFHNVTAYYPNLMATTQGTDDPQGNTQDGRNRIGTDIIARGMKVKVMFISKVDRPNLNIHCYLFKYNTTFFDKFEPTAPAGAGDSIFWAGPLGVGADSNRLLDHPNTDRVNPIKKLVVQNRNVNTGESNNRVTTVYREFYIPFKNWKVRYDNDTGGGKFPMYKDIGLAVVAYDTPDTNELQSVAYVTATTCLYFKDP